MFTNLLICWWYGAKKISKMKQWINMRNHASILWSLIHSDKYVFCTRFRDKRLMPDSIGYFSIVLLMYYTLTSLQYSSKHERIINPITVDHLQNWQTTWPSPFLFIISGYSKRRLWIGITFPGIIDVTANWIGVGYIIRNSILQWNEYK